jgi:hypothetical protein
MLSAVFWANVFACAGSLCDQPFLYMELVQGVIIRECWADLSDETKMEVCAPLKPMMHAAGAKTF